MSGFRKATGEAEWSPILGTDDGYEVSHYGHVRRVRAGRVVMRAQHSDKYGYRKVTLRRAGQPSTRGVHRLVAEAFIGPCPAGLQVNHRDADKTNNHVHNLEYVTAGENSRHAAALGRRSGENNANAKMTVERVARMRDLYATGDFTQAELGELFGISQVQVSNIVHCRRGGWKD